MPTLIQHSQINYYFFKSIVVCIGMDKPCKFRIVVTSGDAEKDRIREVLQRTSVVAVNIHFIYLSGFCYKMYLL